MCIKLGDELNTVKSLMYMSLNAIIADTFDLDLNELSPNLRLRDDLKMDNEGRDELNDLIGEYFDGLQIDFSNITTLEELYDMVVEKEFENIAVNG